MPINNRTLGLVLGDLVDPATIETNFRRGLTDVATQLDLSTNRREFADTTARNAATTDETIWRTGDTAVVGTGADTEYYFFASDSQTAGAATTDDDWLQLGEGTVTARRVFTTTALRNAATTADTLWRPGDIAVIEPQGLPPRPNQYFIYTSAAQTAAAVTTDADWTEIDAAPRIPSTRIFSSIARRNATTTADSLWQVGDLASVFDPNDPTADQVYYVYIGDVSGRGQTTAGTTTDAEWAELGGGGAGTRRMVFADNAARNLDAAGWNPGDLAVTNEGTYLFGSEPSNGSEDSDWLLIGEPVERVEFASTTARNAATTQRWRPGDLAAILTTVASPPMLLSHTLTESVNTESPVSGSNQWSYNHSARSGAGFDFLMGMVAASPFDSTGFSVPSQNGPFIGTITATAGSMITVTVEPENVGPPNGRIYNFAITGGTWVTDSTPPGASPTISYTGSSTTSAPGPVYEYISAAQTTAAATTDADWELIGGEAATTKRRAFASTMARNAEASVQWNPGDVAAVSVAAGTTTTTPFGVTPTLADYNTATAGPDNLVLVFNNIQDAMTFDTTIRSLAGGSITIVTDNDVLTYSLDGPGLADTYAFTPFNPVIFFGHLATGIPTRVARTTEPQWSFIQGSTRLVNYSFVSDAQTTAAATTDTDWNRLYDDITTAIPDDVTAAPTAAQFNAVLGILRELTGS